MGCTLYDGGGVKEVLSKHLLPFNPFVHQRFRHFGGGEEVFLQNSIFLFILPFLLRQLP